MSKAIVIGSGIAGMAAGLRLRHKGYEVTIFESSDRPGGKIKDFHLDGYRFDMGPSLFTMPNLVDELYELYGEDPRVHYKFTRKKIICNYFWEDGTTFSAPSHIKDFAEKAAATFKTKPNIILNYIESSSKKYEITAPIFLENSLHKASTYFSIDALKRLIKFSKLDLLKTLHQVNKESFTNPKLIQLFDRYATYNGSSPYKTPGIMSMIPHLEMEIGTFLPEGGMVSIPESLYQFSLTKGIEYRFNERVKKINSIKGCVIGVETDISTYDAESVIANADVYNVYKYLLPELPKPKKILEQERSSSALVFYWGIRAEFPQLDLHNILFSDDYEEEFKSIFERNTIFEDPTIYINITSKEEKSDAPKGCENWFVMINVPPNFDQDWDKLKEIARNSIIKKINKCLKINIEDLIVVEKYLDPILIEKQTNSFRGSLYGTASNSKYSAFLRHPNYYSNLKGLYFCGGSVHPGGGIPLCLKSAKIVTNMISDVN